MGVTKVYYLPFRFKNGVLRLIVVKTICERSQSEQILKKDRRSGGFRKEKRKRGGIKKDNPKMGNGRTKKVSD